ncbi:Dolichyl-phosphate-mannose--protein mannosyltransferase 1 [Neocucurbitaria cava]|uniref:Dolichyl-phosphate-mannose--protein mannosyltransferase n=1 Tax=Neocucurbitaria cava TaxID=798079 RepID=A0A9W8YEG0_9PLEO|nr:Dolichyl-phosphate-mannose--protein mannosyltransferase 1 [Neocucurbitaria cava]
MTSATALNKLMASLTWSNINLTPKCTKNAAYDLVLASQELLEELMNESGVVFAPSLLDAVQSAMHPALSDFKSLSVLPGKWWAVYLLVLEKPGSRPKIYIGSGTNRYGGVSERLRMYDSESVLPMYVKRALDNGYAITHRGFLCWAPLPKEGKIYLYRLLFLALESMFSLVFWAMVSRTKDYGLPHLCPWDIESLDYDGCCTHTALMEGIVGAEDGLTLEQIAAKETECRKWRVDQITRLAKNCKRRAIEDRTFACNICSILCNAQWQLDRHLATKKHMKRASGVTKPSNVVAWEHKNVVAKRFPCYICSRFFGSQQKLTTHLASQRHQDEAAASSDSKQVPANEAIDEILVIWWSSTALIGLYIAIKGLAILRWQRGYRDYSNVTFKRFDYEVGMSILGWAFHYFPFYLMARQLFLHHYLPALYFAILALCQMFDFVSYRFSVFGLKQYPAIGQAAAVGFLAVAITVFTVYAPLAYGNAWTKDACNTAKLFGSWDWDCNNFLTSYEAYNSQTTPVASISAPSSAPPPPVAPQIPRQQEQPKEAKPEEVVSEQAAVSPPPQDVPKDLPVLSKEERIEYRDENGRVLNDDEVQALAGKVSFKTRYETRTRIIDGQGNEIYEGLVDAHGAAEEQGVAPPHPDVEGRNPETQQLDQAAEASEAPPTVEVVEDQQKEKSVEQHKNEAKPASEAQAATQE